MSDYRFRQTSDEVAQSKATMQAAWNLPGAAYQEMAETLRPAVEHLLDHVRVRAGMALMDAATGTGIAAIEAARRGADVTGVDFAPDLVAVAQDHARDASIEQISFAVSDIEQLPYPDAMFDAVISSFGSIFAPRHDAVAAELSRVLRPGGVLAFTSWKPQGPNQRLMTLMAPYLPPPPPESFNVLDWGRAQYVRQMLAPYFDEIAFAEGNVPWRAVSPSDAIDMLFYRSLGPTMYLFSRFDDATKRRVHADAIALMSDCLQPDGTVCLGRDYLITRAIRRV